MESIPLVEIGEQPVGGKAAGLARLIRLGMQVPPGFVLVGLDRGDDGGLPREVRSAYRALGASTVAVRSSALDEDGKQDSFAGQYETVLDVSGEAALAAAIRRCVASASSQRASAYRAERRKSNGHDGDVAGTAGAARGANSQPMAVIVQRMVAARAAGVVFTADPVSGRRDRMVVDAVAGLGEALVSGQVTPDHYVLSPHGELVQQELTGEHPILTQGELRRIARQARQAARAAGTPLDLEWAWDSERGLCWLQSRPITTLGADPRELDTPCAPTDVLTMGNTSEMMPGAVGALTLSTTVRGIDHGTQDMLVRCGALPGPQPELVTVGLHFGHIFFNLSTLRRMANYVAGSTGELLALAICGRVVPELGPDRPVGALRRALNGARYFSYVLSQARPVRRLERFLRTFELAPGSDARVTWQRLDETLEVLDWSYDVHLQSSAGSGVSTGVIAGILARGERAGPKEEAALARLLAEATGVESAELVFALDRLGERIAAQRTAGERFSQPSPAAALQWLRGEASGDAGRAFAGFLQRHGHRSFRELDMRQPCWADDPEPLVRALQANVRAQGAYSPRPAESTPTPTAPVAVPLSLRPLVAWARQTVRNREHTKSILVDVTNRFKRVYRRLGEQMTAEGLLDDADAVFHLTHAELGAQLRRPTARRRAVAVARRKVLAHQLTLELPLVCVGPPEPLSAADQTQPYERVLQGRPVSTGIVEGPVRVARTVSEAETLHPGEILVAPVTDVGWTPYFRLLAGLVTEVGSAISHGAVVAREYGLPAVVNVDRATHRLRTGQRVRLDGDAGTLTLLDGDDSVAQN